MTGGEFVVFAFTVLNLAVSWLYCARAMDEDQLLGTRVVSGMAALMFTSLGVMWVVTALVQ